jgi:hypothetical protein
MQKEQLHVEKPFRVGVFDTVDQADRAVRNLLAAGFRKDQLSVMCSDKHKEQFFHNVPNPEPAGTHAGEAVVAGSLIGATIGGLALAASALVTGGATVLIYGPFLVGGAALAGSFTGAMMTRGFKREIADYYAQAVQDGKILVAVELEGKHQEPRLAEAERILADAGVEPVALTEG